MSPDGMSWKAKYRDVYLLLRQCGPRDFQIAVGDGTLTHFHPAKGCDFNSARLRAYDHAVRFARLRPHSVDDPAEQVVALEWEPIESEETKGAEPGASIRQDGNTMSGPDPSV